MEIGIILNSPSDIGEVNQKDIIFADGGYKFKKQLKDKNVLAVIGDFDSYKSKIEGENVIKCNEKKDFSDGESAVKLAKKLGATSVVIYGATGGRIDHVICNLTLLSIAKKEGIEAIIKTEEATVRLVDGFYSSKKETESVKGKTVSLLPFTDVATVESSFGLFYPLCNLTLTKSDTVGLSNVVIENEFSFNVKNGLILLIINKTK